MCKKVVLKRENLLMLLGSIHELRDGRLRRWDEGEDCAKISGRFFRCDPKSEDPNQKVTYISCVVGY